MRCRSSELTTHLMLTKVSKSVEIYRYYSSTVHFDKRNVPHMHNKFAIKAYNVTPL